MIGEQAEKHVLEIEESVRCKNYEIVELRAALEILEQYSRRKNAEIHGVVQTGNEDLDSVIGQLAVTLDLPKVPQASC